jgi:hypothetical protein
VARKVYRQGYSAPLPRPSPVTPLRAERR